jgi:hypothetical protein
MSSLRMKGRVEVVEVRRVCKAVRGLHTPTGRRRSVVESRRKCKVCKEGRWDSLEGLHLSLRVDDQEP